MPNLPSPPNFPSSPNAQSVNIVKNLEHSLSVFKLVVIGDNALFERALRDIAASLSSPFLFLAKPFQLDDHFNASLACNYEWVLFYNDKKALTLSHLHHKTLQNFYLDYADNTFLLRLKQAAPAVELLLKALGKRASALTILDATLGFGRDSLVLASYCQKVIGLERHPLVYCLVQNAVERARFNGDLKPLISKVSFYQADSLSWMQSNKKHEVDVVYCDPMFPERQKSALVKKNMQILHALLCEEEPFFDEGILLEAARNFARKSVVVKRPLHAKPLGEQKPSHAILGKDARYDVYRAL